MWHSQIKNMLLHINLNIMCIAIFKFVLVLCVLQKLLLKQARFLDKNFHSLGEKLHM